MPRTSADPSGSFLFRLLLRLSSASPSCVSFVSPPLLVLVSPQSLPMSPPPASGDARSRLVCACSGAVLRRWLQHCVSTCDLRTHRRLVCHFVHRGAAPIFGTLPHVSGHRARSTSTGPCSFRSTPLCIGPGNNYLGLVLVQATLDTRSRAAPFKPSGPGCFAEARPRFRRGPWAAGHRLLVAATWGLSPGVLRSLLTWQAFFLHAVSFNF